MGVAGGCAISLGEVGSERVSFDTGERGVVSLGIEGSGLDIITSSGRMANAFCRAGPRGCGELTPGRAGGGTNIALVFELMTFLTNML